MSVFRLKRAELNEDAYKKLQNTSAEPVTSTQRRAYEASIDSLVEKYGVPAALDYDSVSDARMPTRIGRKVLEGSHPMRELVKKYPLDRLISWEIFARCFSTPYIEMISRRRDADPHKIIKVKVRSFHVNATNGELETMMRIVNKVSQISGSRIEWIKLLVPCDEKKLDETHRQFFVKSAEGCGYSMANIRAWENQLAISMKGMDFYVDNLQISRGKFYSFLFVLSNLSIGGHCVINLPHVADTQLTFAVCVFTDAFENTEILHSVVEDRVFIYGESFRGVGRGALEMLAEIGLREDFSANYGPTLEVFNKTIEGILEAFGAINNWRYNYYDKVLSATKHLTNSYSAATFDHYSDTYISDHFPENSARWLAATEFPREWIEGQKKSDM